MRRIRFRDWADPALLGGAQVAVAVTEVEISDAGPVVSVTVRGLSVGASELSVDLVLGGSRRTATVVPDAGRWRADETLVTDGADALSIEAVASGPPTAADRVAVALQDGRPRLSPGTRATAGAGNGGFLAGTSDRIAQRRTFVPLVGKPYFKFPWGVAGDLVLYGAAGVGQLSSKAVTAALSPVVESLHDDLVAGTLDMAGYVNEVEQAAEKAVMGAVKSAPAKRAKHWHALFGQQRSARHARLSWTATGTDDDVIIHEGAAFTALDVTAAVRWLRKQLLGESAIGLVFLERIRYQPAGLFVGEPLCTVSLTPGEEVQVRQSVETKRRATLEEIREREQERGITLSSTWSTDVSEAATESQARTSSNTVSANLTPGELPIPISGGVNGSATVTGAHDTSTENSVTRTFEQSSEATARMRAQHRTRIEVTTESTTGFATTRTLRNANHQRAVTYILSKIYRRERATLERYGARLCLRLSVADPSAATRNAFLRGVDLIDPDNPALYEAVLPQAVRADALLAPVDMPRVGSVAAGGGRETRRSALMTLRDVLPTDQRPPEGFRLLFATALLEQWYYEETAHPENEHDYGPGEADSRFFGDWAGAITWYGTPPIVGETDPRATIQVAYNYDSKPSDSDEDWYRSGPRSVHVRLQTLWAPDEAEWAAVRDQRESRRAELLAACTPDAVAALRDTADRDYRGGVLAAALLTAFGGEADAVGLQLHQLLDLDEAYVDTVPWWATQGGRATYEKLLSRIRRLPIDVSLTDVLSGSLTDAHAFVNIPVREGRETELLRLVAGTRSADRARWVNELTAFRTASFTPNPTTLPTDLEVVGPTPPMGTPAGKGQWDSGFEQPARRFVVLGQWAEAIPTDGVHTEMLLSDTVATDEHRVAELERGARLDG